MNKISANECAGRHVRFNVLMPTYMSGQLEDMNAVSDLGCVVEDTVECNSWGKSRSDQMCHFPNTGGLHRTSEDAPFKTQLHSRQQYRKFTYCDNSILRK